MSMAFLSMRSRHLSCKMSPTARREKRWLYLQATCTCDLEVTNQWEFPLVQKKISCLLISEKYWLLSCFLTQVDSIVEPGTTAGWGRWWWRWRITWTSRSRHWQTSTGTNIILWVAFSAYFYSLKTDMIIIPSGGNRRNLFSLLTQ